MAAATDGHSIRVNSNPHPCPGIKDLKQLGDVRNPAETGAWTGGSPIIWVRESGITPGGF